MNLAFRSSPLIWPLKCASSSDILRPVAGTTARISAPVGKGTGSSGTAATGGSVSDCISKVSVRHRTRECAVWAVKHRRDEDIEGEQKKGKKGNTRTSRPTIYFSRLCRRRSSCGVGHFRAAASATLWRSVLARHAQLQPDTPSCAVAHLAARACTTFAITA